MAIHWESFGKKLFLHNWRVILQIKNKLILNNVWSLNIGSVTLRSRVCLTIYISGVLHFPLWMFILLSSWLLVLYCCSKSWFENTKRRKDVFWLLLTNRWMSLWPPRVLFCFLSLWISDAVLRSLRLSLFSLFSPLWYLHYFFIIPTSLSVWWRRTVLCVFSWVVCCH